MMATATSLTSQPIGKAAMEAARKSSRSEFGLIRPAIPISATAPRTAPAGTCPRRQIWFADSPRKKISHAAANWRSTRAVGLVRRGKSTITSIRLEGREVFGLLGGRGQMRYFFFAGDEIFQDQQVHISGEETAQGIVGSANDGFAA